MDAIPGEGSRVQAKQPVLAAEALAFSYGGAPVLDGISFALHSGETALLSGPNGAGKSTLLRCLAGWSRSDSGEVRLAGERIRGSDRAFRRQLVLVPDTPAFYDDLTAEEHIQFVARANRDTACESRAIELLESLGLDSHKGAYPSTFSRGMRYKLALAIALALMPDVLLLDEPFGPLDAESSQVLVAQTVEASRRGGAVLVSGHQTPSGFAPDVRLTLGHHGLKVKRSAPPGPDSQDGEA